MKTKQKIIICAVIAVVCLSMVSHPVRPEAEAEEPQQVEAGTLVEYIEPTEPEATPAAVHEPDDAEYIAHSPPPASHFPFSAGPASGSAP